MLQTSIWRKQSSLVILLRPHLLKEVGWIMPGYFYRRTILSRMIHSHGQQTGIVRQTAITQPLPLFYDKAASVSMINHAMDVVLQATQFLNAGQIPVIACDNSLYAIAKSIQWAWPASHGIDKFLVMQGGLHIEMALWNTVGDYLEDSGWTTALTNADVASAGKADSVLKTAHLARTRHSHQITALALEQLEEEAFLFTGLQQDADTREAWRNNMIEKSPTFQYWNTILNIEITGLIMIRAHRDHNFSLYVELP